MVLGQYRLIEADKKKLTTVNQVETFIVFIGFEIVIFLLANFCFAQKPVVKIENLCRQTVRDKFVFLKIRTKETVLRVFAS